MPLVAGRLADTGRTTHLFTWRGTAFNALAAVMFVSAGYQVEAHDVGVEVEGIEASELIAQVPRLLGMLEIGRLSRSVEGLRRAKYDGYVSEELLRANWCRRNEGLLSELASFPESIPKRDGAGDPAGRNSW